MQSSYENNYAKRAKTFVFALAVFIILFAAYQIYASRRLHVVSTNPGVNDMATVSPFLKINFNKQLSARDLSVSSSYSVAKSYRVEGKTLFVTLDSPMTAGYSYYVKINTVSDVDGHKITNRAFSFTPTEVDWQNLSKDQQKAIIQLQANRPKSISDIDFEGLDKLTDYGVSSGQVANLEQEFFDFDKNAAKVLVNASDISPVPHDRNSASTINTINFKVTVGSKTYNASIAYSANLANIQLVLRSLQDNSLVYDSVAAVPNEE